MADTIEGYLAELRAALAGADPALVQDALYDAEDCLRTSAAEGGNTPEAIAAAIDSYGEPAEVADAYRNTEATVVSALKPTARPHAHTALGTFVSVLGDPAAWGSLFYMVLALATGIAYFTVVVTGLSLTAGLAVMIVGIPFALLFIATVRAISLAEGRLVEALLGERMPRRPRTAGQCGTLWERIKGWFTDWRTWTTMIYMGLMLPIGITYFTIIVTAVALSLAFIAAPFIQAIWDVPMFVFGGEHLRIMWWAAPVFVLGGACGLVTTLWIAKAVGHLHGAFAKVMLVGRTES